MCKIIIKHSQSEINFICMTNRSKLYQAPFITFASCPNIGRIDWKKLKALGCNTVETYVPWNMHEPREGEYHFAGMYDIRTFIQTAAKLGLYVILLLSPYICAEWEFGGLPFWLLRDGT